MLQLLEVVAVGAVVDVHLSPDALSAFRAGFPLAFVAFHMMGSAECQPAVVAMAAIPGIGKELVVVLVIADPLPTAFRPNQLRPLPAEEAALGWIQLWCWDPRYFGLLSSLCWHEEKLPPRGGESGDDKLSVSQPGVGGLQASAHGLP